MGRNKNPLDNYYMDDYVKVAPEEPDMEGEPDGDYGVRMVFTATFVTEEMEPVFMKAAREFIKKEPMIGDGTLFQGIPLPYKDSGMKSTFIHTMLGMMLACTLDGSSYSSGLILELYKAYYKKEYNVLKRFRKMDLFSYSDAFEDGMEEDDMASNATSARITVMCQLMGIGLDSSWNVVHNILNDNEKRERAIWRAIEAIGMEDGIQSRRESERGKCAAWLTENYPEMASSGAYGQDERYGLLERLEGIVEAALENAGVRTEWLMDGHFDLYSNAVESLLGNLGEEGEGGGTPTLRETIMAAYLNHVASALGRLYRERQDELRGLFGVTQLEIMDDAAMESETIEKELLLRLARSREREPAADFRGDKVLEKIHGLKPEVTEAPKALGQMEGCGMEAPEDDAPRQEEPLDFVMGKELVEARERARGAERKLEAQRALYEECRERVKALEKIVESQAGEHAELVALREMAHGLGNHGSIPDTPAMGIGQMAEDLNGLNGAIIGGQEPWANRMKQRLPAWKMIPVGESLKLDRVLGSVDVAFLFTDILTHAMYHKMIGTLRKNGIPFHFIHSQNEDRTIRSMYGAAISGQGGK